MSDIDNDVDHINKNTMSSTTLSSAAGTDISDETDDHINVVLRVRPENMQEVTRQDTFNSSFPGSGTIEVDHNSSVRSFTYNVVFECDATQEELFEHSGVRKLVDMALNGYACTALAFGQTGSGKTHTMTGPPQQFQDGKQINPKMYGLIQRSLFYMFQQLDQQGVAKRIRASYLEIYNEQVIDLLNANHKRYLQVRWSKHRGFYVENLFMVECNGVDDLMVVLEEGYSNDRIIFKKKSRPKRRKEKNFIERTVKLTTNSLEDVNFMPALMEDNQQTTSASSNWEARQSPREPLNTTPIENPKHRDIKHHHHKKDSKPSQSPNPNPNSGISPEHQTGCVDNKEVQYVLRANSHTREASARSEKHSAQTKSSGMYEFPEVNDDEDIDMEDIGEMYDGNDVYVFYLMTDDGAIVGPFRMDIDNIDIGLPKSVEKVEPSDKDEGMRNRQTGSHGLNEFSSRSHSMLTLTIDSDLQDTDDENLFITKRGKLTFVDLAGSEKVKDSHSTAESLFESNNINKSLLVLGNCISSLGDSKKRHGHIPYRDSKLTKLLADSLGGSGVTLMVACVTPSSHHVSETMNTLRYASRAKKIKTKPIIKMDPREKLILNLKKEIKVLRNENAYLRQQLEFSAKPKEDLQKENDETFLSFLKGQEKETAIPTQQQDDNGLYEMLQEYMVENEALRTENTDMHSTRDMVKREQELMNRENERLIKKVEGLERTENTDMHSTRDMVKREQELMNRENERLIKKVEGLERTENTDMHSTRDMVKREQELMNRENERLIKKVEGLERMLANNNVQFQAPRANPPPEALLDQPRGSPGQPYSSRPPLHGSGLQGRLPPQDMSYAGHPPGYTSPSGGRGKQGPLPGSGQLKKPPHRLAEPIQRPALIPYDTVQNGSYSAEGYVSPRLRAPSNHQQSRQESPRRSMDSRRASHLSTSEVIKTMNDKLRDELRQLEGEITQHEIQNRRTKEMGYGSQASIR